MDFERCLGCGAPRERGFLCVACADRLIHDDGRSDARGDVRGGLCAEQITSRPVLVDGVCARAWLVDGFGVPHAIAVPKKAAPTLQTITIGRRRDSDVQIAERTISALHATLEYRPLSNAWFVVDAGSDNGVFVDDDRVPRRFPLEPGDRIMLGRRLGLLFVPIDDVDTDAADTALSWWREQGFVGDTSGDSGGADAISLRVSAVTEGGAVASWAAERVSLSELEYELLVCLHRRFVDDDGLDDSVRGFVPAALLLETLRFKSEAPTHANLRGLVRKLRRKLADGDPPVDVIESRQGLGYRLARPIQLS